MTQVTPPLPLALLLIIAAAFTGCEGAFQIAVSCPIDTCILYAYTGQLSYMGPVFIGEVDRAAGTSVQLRATSSNENATVEFTIDEVTDGQEAFVELNSTGYLTIKPNATADNFFIDVSLHIRHGYKRVCCTMCALDYRL